MRVFIVFLLLSATTAFPQQRPEFSEKTVEIDERVFLPYTKGEVVRKIDGPQKPVLDQICSIITSWDSIAPPQGVKVFCSGFDNLLEIYFLPYLFEEGNRYASEGGPNLSITVNDPNTIGGSPVVSGIFLCPQKKKDFHGYPVYQNDHQEIAIVYKKTTPLFIPVSQEDYLKALIANEGKKAPKDLKSDYLKALKEMEQVYEDLLKTDAEAAKEFKQGIAEFKNEIAKNGNQTGTTELTALLKKELSALSAEERNRPAYYAGALAMEKFQNVSGMVPFASREKGAALVRPNPALTNNSSANQIQLLVISWSISPDNPGSYNRGRTGFDLADDLMRKLYREQHIWSKIFSLCN